MTSSPLLNREPILSALRAALEPLDYVHAMWEGGSESFGRTDDWSDIDLQIDVDDDRVNDTLRVVESTLQALSPIAERMELPQPTWHGHAQVFYRLDMASPFLLVDLCVMKHSNPQKFLEPEVHGPARFHFNKGNSVEVKPLDKAAHLARLEKRLVFMRAQVSMLHRMVGKELARQHPATAFDYYYRLTLTALVDALRMIHGPFHFDFRAAYLYHELPPEVTARLTPLFFVRDEDDLRSKAELAFAWFEEAAGSVSVEEIAGAMGR